MSSFTPAQRDWIDALRSGEYTQCHGVMIEKTGDGTSHCCLGVAGDRYIKNGGEGIRIAPGDYNNSLGAAGDYGFKVDNKVRVYVDSDLPPAVEEYLNLRAAYRELAGLNDDGTTFEQIADELEAHPEKYFTNFNS